MSSNGEVSLVQLLLRQVEDSIYEKWGIRKNISSKQVKEEFRNFLIKTKFHHVEKCTGY